VSPAEQEHEPTDGELIQRCRGGQGSAWKALVARYGTLVYSVCRSTGLTEADASDITQQTFCILHDSLDRLKPETRLGPWLATVARRHSWRVRARLQREAPEAPDELTRHVEAGDEEAEKAPAWERLEWLHHGLSLLDERCRKLLTELYLRAEPAPYEAVARRLKIAVGSIGPTRARCLAKLRGLLEPA
jgi:RNA polymerase sigma factor (sigma-70 family)